jgi:putative copper resistance protein D
MSYPLRALVMFLSTPFHTVLGLTVMQSSSLIAGPYYQSLALSWSDPHSDQQLAGGILWAGGEIVSVVMLGVLVLQWIKQSEREARRIDRALDRQEALERAAARAAADGGAGDDAVLAADLAALDEVDAEAREPVDDELTLGTIDAQVSPEHRRNIR